MKTWREPYPLFADDLSLSARRKQLGTPSPPSPAGREERALDTGSAAGSATAASTIVYTYPAAGRAPSVAIGRADFTTMYVSWLTARDTFHLAC